MKLPYKLRLSQINYRASALIAVWFISLIIGLHIASIFHIHHNGLYFAAASKPAGFTGLLAVFFLPLLLTIVALHFDWIWLIYLLAASKAFTLGFNSFMLLHAFGQGAWLARHFLLFSDTISSFLLLSLWFISFSKKGRQLHTYHLAYAIISLLTIIIDLYLISPFFSEVVIG